MKLTIDFEGTEILYENEGSKGTIIITDLAERKAAVLDALGLKEEPMEDLRKDIDNLFAELGINAECARPQ